MTYHSSFVRKEKGLSMTIKVCLINENGASFIDIENDYKAFEKALAWDDFWNCPSIDIAGQRFIAVVSDTGKIRKQPVSAITMLDLVKPKETLREPFLVGTIIITKFDGTDDFASLSPQDVELIESRLFTHSKIDNYFDTILVLD
jgi:hypothetical protein